MTTPIQHPASNSESRKRAAEATLTGWALLDAQDRELEEYMSGAAKVAMRIEPVGPCNVAPTLGSQWRNGDHWHTIWPEGDYWCYPTAEAAADRAIEVTALRSAAEAAS